MAFFVFLLLNAVLFIRPEELFPELAGLQIYQALILTCTLLSAGSVLRQLTWTSLRQQPITVCVIGLLAAVTLSHVSRLRFGLAWEEAYEFTKVVLYYLLFLGIVNTPARLRWFLVALLAFIVVLTGLALLQYRGLVNFEALRTLEQNYSDETGDVIVILRLRSTGIYNDPNDLCLILVVGMALAVYLSGDRRAGAWRYLWLLPLGLFGYALMLTQSRGGMLAMLGTFLVFCWTRYGWRKAAILGMVAVPVFLVVFGGRQTRFDLGDREDTAQHRIQLWSEGLAMMRWAPLFGIGSGQYVEEAVQVAHNSFVHAYTELGLFGGTLYLGAWYLAFLTLIRLSPRVTSSRPELARLRPYLLALMAGYAVGMWSLSRCYIVPTYMLLALIGGYARLAVPPSIPALPCLDGRLVGRLALVSFAGLAGIHLFVRVFVRYGG